MSIRQATLADVSALALMGAEFCESSPYGGYSVTDCEASLTQIVMTGGVFVAEYGQEIIGAIGGMLAPMWFAPSGPKMAVELFWWVKPEARGGSAGVKLIGVFEAWAKREGAASVVMSCLETIEPDKVSGMLNRLGFKQAERSFIRGL